MEASRASTSAADWLCQALPLGCSAMAGAGGMRWLLALLAPPLARPTSRSRCSPRATPKARSSVLPCVRMTRTVARLARCARITRPFDAAGAPRRANSSNQISIGQPVETVALNPLCVEAPRNRQPPARRHAAWCGGASATETTAGWFVAQRGGLRLASGSPPGSKAAATGSDVRVVVGRHQHSQFARVDSVVQRQRQAQQFSVVHHLDARSRARRWSVAAPSTR